MESNGNGIAMYNNDQKSKSHSNFGQGICSSYIKTGTANTQLGVPIKYNAHSGIVQLDFINHQFVNQLY